MRYFPLSDTRGLILNDEDQALTIHHDPDTEVMTWVFGEGKPTVFNRQSAEDYIEIITDYPEWIAVPHPQNEAIRQAAAAILDSNVKGARYRNAEKIIADISARMNQSPQPLTGRDEYTGEAI